MKKILLIVFIALLSSDFYAKELDVKVQIEPNIEERLINDTFQSIVRFKPLYLDNRTLTDESKVELDSIVNIVNEYKKKNKNFFLNIIAYTNPAQTNDERVVRELTYSFQDLFGNIKVNGTTNTGLDDAKNIAKYLINKDVPNDKIFVEKLLKTRELYLENIQNQKKINQRVMVVLYEK